MENYILLLAAVFCGVSTALSLSKSPGAVKKVSSLAWLLSVILTVIAVALLTFYLLTGRFEYQYVYSHTSLSTSPLYRISSLWSGQEGSFLLWALIMAVMGLFIRKTFKIQASKSLRIYNMLYLCILIMCFITKPFAAAEVIYSDGLGLNTALQDPWMVIHPPLVFVSYTSMAVLFSLSAVITDKTDKKLSKTAKFWIQFSYIFLGLGILTGSIWAYRALGWGGYWAWDPIENAALVPWLILSAFLHRREYTSKTVCLVPFPVACFGVFLVRSGILKEQSVHAYTNGNLIIAILLICLSTGSFLLLILEGIKRRRSRLTNHPDTIIPIIKNLKLSKKASGIISTVLKLKSAQKGRLYMQTILFTYALVIFLGTVIPIFTKAGTPVSFYNTVSTIFAAVYSAALLMSGLRWVKKRYIPMMAVSTLLVIGIMLLTKAASFKWLFLLWFCLLPLSLWISCGFRTRSAGFYLVHTGIVLLIIGVIGSSALGSKGYIITSGDEAGYVSVEGNSIPTESLNRQSMLIKVLPAKDILLDCSNSTVMSQDSRLIPYSTKPLIMLFWIGSFLTVLSPCIISIKERYLFTRQPHKP